MLEATVLYSVNHLWIMGEYLVSSLQTEYEDIKATVQIFPFQLVKRYFSRYVFSQKYPF